MGDDETGDGGDASRATPTPAAPAPVRTPDRVVRAYLVIVGVWTVSAALIWGVFALFLLDAGLTIFEVFVANAAFTTGMVIFEVPTGVVADVWGRRTSFLLSAATLSLGTAGYVALAQAGLGLVPYVVVSVFLGLGFTFYSGATEAWLVDALDATGFSGDMDGVFSKAGQVTALAMLVGTVGGGVLGDVDLALPFLLRSALLAVLFVLAYRWMHDIGFEPKVVTGTGLSAVRNEVARVGRASMEHGWKVRPLRGVFALAGLQTAFMFWGWYAWQPYFLELLGQRAIWVAGVVAAALALSMMAGNWVAGRLVRHVERRTTILLWAFAVEAMGILGVGLATSFPVAFGFFVVAALALGVTQPVQQSYLHKLVPSEHRATVVSFSGLVGSAGGSAGQVALGRISEDASIPAGYLAGGALVGLSLPVVAWMRGLGGKGDRIEGPGAGPEGQGPSKMPAAAVGVEGSAGSGPERGLGPTEDPRSGDGEGDA